MADFVEYGQDEFRPQYGEVNWTPRLNALLEATGVELVPVGYSEDGDYKMQVTQENTIVYINQVADEMDCVAIKYDKDPDDIWTFYWRESFKSVTFEQVVGAIGAWSMQCITLYPMEHVVKQYEAHQSSDLNSYPDWLPEA